MFGERAVGLRKIGLAGLFILVMSALRLAGQTDPNSLRSLPYVSMSPGKQATESGVIAQISEKTSPGVTFYVNRYLCTAHLIDGDGNILHEWKLESSASWIAAELMPSGRLLVIGAWDPTKKVEYPNEQGFSSYITLLDRNSRVLWKRTFPAHHDIHVLRDGGILTLAEKERNVRGFDHPIIDNAIAMLSSRGDVLTEISLYDVLSRAGVVFEKVAANTSEKIDLFHANSVEIVTRQKARVIRKTRPASSIYKSQNLLFCSRHQNLIGLVSWSEKRLLWTWGKGILDGPHAASLLDNGDILVFDNGLTRGYSRVMQIDPVHNNIVWQWEAPNRESLYSITGGYCERLPNGNTFITNSWKFEAIEITKRGEIVWDYVSPVPSFVFRFERYPLRYFSSDFKSSWGTRKGSS